jgi:glycine/serine hydroxymethyltransferase
MSDLSQMNVDDRFQALLQRYDKILDLMQAQDKHLSHMTKLLRKLVKLQELQIRSNRKPKDD